MCWSLLSVQGLCAGLYRVVCVLLLVFTRFAGVSLYRIYVSVFTGFMWGGL